MLVYTKLFLKRIYENYEILEMRHYLVGKFKVMMQEEIKQINTVSENPTEYRNR